MFTGRRLDILDGGSLTIQYNRNRYYDPETGRWLTHDPLGITPNPPKPNVFDVMGQYNNGINLYEHIKSSPVLRLDPTGLRGLRTQIGCGFFCAPSFGWLERIEGSCPNKCWPFERDLRILGHVITIWPLSPEKQGEFNKIKRDILVIGKVASCSDVPSLAWGQLMPPEAVVDKLIEEISVIRGYRLFLKVQIKECQKERCGFCWLKKRWNWKKKFKTYYECTGGEGWQDFHDLGIDRYFGLEGGDGRYISRSYAEEAVEPCKEALEKCLDHNFDFLVGLHCLNSKK